MNIWAELGIAPTDDRSTIRRAYARKLKLNRPDGDPAGFERLRFAYELALGEAEARADRHEEHVADARPMEPAPASAPSTGSIIVRHVIAPDPETETETETESQPETVTESGPELEPEANRPAERIVEELGKALHASESERATDLFHELLAHESMADFESRWQLEEWLLSTLTSKPTPSPAFIRAAERHFRWQEDATRLPPQFHDLVDGLLAELELADALDDLRRRSGGFISRLTGGRRELARRLLGGAHRPFWLDYASLSVKTFEALKQEWQAIEIFGPDALSRQLGRSKYEWWNTHVESGPHWFLRFVQYLQRFVFLAVAATALFCAAMLPSFLTERITGGSLFFAVYVPYIGITVGAPLLLHVSSSALSVFVVRLERRLEETLARPIAAADRRLGFVKRHTLDRYRRWLGSLSPRGRRYVDNVLLVLTACAIWVGFFLLLWIDGR